MVRTVQKKSTVEPSTVSYSLHDQVSLELHSEVASIGRIEVGLSVLLNDAQRYQGIERSKSSLAEQE